jgi:general secretion pathway protein G
MNSSRSLFSHRNPIANERGLTLIEIMVVLLIVGGLAATLGQAVFNNLARSNVQQTKLRFGEIAKALEMYNGDCGGFPTTEQGLQVLMADPGKEVCPNWGPKAYTTKPVTIDSWSRPIIYESDGTNYVLKSLGSDRRENGTGDAKDLIYPDDSAPATK